MSEKAAAVLKSAGIAAGIAFLCYNSFFFVFLLIPYCIYFVRKQEQKKRDEKKWRLNLQFADAVKSLSAALEAGYSVENGLSEAYRDLELSYKEDDPIMVELRSIIGDIRNSVSAEEAFSGFAQRSEIEDIKGFADVFATAKRTGGNIIAIIRSTTDMIRTRIDLKREVKAATAAAKYEADIMKLVPFGVLLYLRIFSPDMISSLYGNVKGMLFMTALLIIYVALSEVMDRMVKIEL